MTNLSHCCKELVEDTTKNKIKQQKHNVKAQIYQVLEWLKEDIKGK